MPDIRVDAIMPPKGTTVAPAGGSLQVPFSLELAHEGPSGVTLAGIFISIAITGTQHRIVDNPLAVKALALCPKRQMNTVSFSSAYGSHRQVV